MVPVDADLVVELKTGDRLTNLRSVLYEVEDAADVHINLRAALEFKPRLRGTLTSSYADKLKQVSKIDKLGAGG